MSAKMEYGELPVPERKRKINLLNLLDILSKAWDDIRQVIGKEIVIVSGATGRGKSTLINGIMGLEFNEGQVGMRKVLEVSDLSKKHAKIGHSTSTTTVPQGFQVEIGDENICLLDTQGFDDDRSTEFDICSHFAIMVCIKLALKIRALLSLVTADEYTETRGMDLVPICDNLNTITHGTMAKKEVCKSILLVTNVKTSDDSSLNPEIIKAELALKKTATEKSQFENRQALARAVSLLQKCDIVVSNPRLQRKAETDKPEQSMEYLREKLLASKGFVVPKDRIDPFGSYRSMIISRCSEIAVRLLDSNHEFVNSKRKYDLIKEEIQTQTDVIRKHEKRIKTLEQQQKNLNDQLQKIIERPESTVEDLIKNLKQRISRSSEVLALKKEQRRKIRIGIENENGMDGDIIVSFRRKKDLLSKELNDLLEDQQLIKCAESTFDEKKELGNGSNWRRNTKTIKVISTRHIRTANANAFLKGFTPGSITEPSKVNSDDHVWEVTYTTPVIEFGKCTLEAYCWPQDTALNQTKILTLKQDLATIDNFIAANSEQRQAKVRKLTSDIDGNEQQIESMEQHITKVVENVSDKASEAKKSINDLIALNDTRLDVERKLLEKAVGRKKALEIDSEVIENEYKQALDKVSPGAGSDFITLYKFLVFIASVNEILIYSSEPREKAATRKGSSLSDNLSLFKSSDLVDFITLVETEYKWISLEDKKEMESLDDPNEVGGGGPGYP